MQLFAIILTETEVMQLQKKVRGQAYNERGERLPPVAAWKRTRG